MVVMPRIARIVLAGIPYHITQRGNGRQQVFFDGTDHRLYLDLLRRNAATAGLTIWAYCLMPNHVHLVAVPARADSLSWPLGRTPADYARHFNLRRRSCGHVWQARFFSCPLDNTHLWCAMAYVERNPVRAGIALEAEQYRWSSARAHISGADPDELLDFSEWRREYDPQRWRDVLRASVGEEAFRRQICEASLRGRPLGDAAFVEELESRAGRRLRPLPVGRPRSSGQDGSSQFTLAIGA